MPETEGEKIQRQIAAIRQQGGTDKDVEAFLGQHPAVKQENTPSPRGASLAPLAQGATLGFADEALGAINGADRFLRGGSFKEGYKEGVDKTRAVGREFAEEHPVANVALEVAGGVVPALATGGAASPSLLRSAATGAGIGGTAGFGGSEGGLKNRLTGAAVGAAAGGVIGGAAPLATELIGKSANVARSVVNRGGKPAADRAKTVLLQAFERDGIPLETLEKANQTRNPKMLLDMGGENLHGVARAAQAIPSRAKDLIPKALYKRQEGLGTRLGKDLEDALGVQGKDVHATADDLLAARRENAKPLYEAAYKFGKVDDPRINEILELPDFQRAYTQARTIAELEGVKLPERLNLSPAAKEVLLNGSPEAKAAIQAAQSEAAPTVQILDYVKRGVDDMIRSGQHAPLESGGLGPTRSRALVERQHELLDLLDKHVPAYKLAREKYSGDLAMERSLEAGRQFLKEEPEVTRRTIAGLKPGERQTFLIGAIDNVKREMADAVDGADLTRRIFGTKSKRANIEALFGDDKQASNRFREWVRNEAKLVQGKNAVLGNSTTAGKQVEISELTGGNIGDVAGSVMTGQHGRAVRDVFRMAASNRLKGVSTNVADELGDALTTRPGTQNYMDLLTGLKAAAKKQRGSVVRRNVFTRAATSATGAELNR
jgi:hypothetical protein